jgi:hypothetical protein
MKKISGVIYGEAGVGVCFGKNAAYPGGAYFISLFLFSKSQHDETLDDDVAKIVLEEINSRLLIRVFLRNEGVKAWIRLI